MLERRRDHKHALEREREKEKGNRERERKGTERETHTQAHELEMQKLAVQRENDRKAHALKMAELQASQSNNGNASVNGVVSHALVASVHRLKLAPFRESDRIEIFISRFEEAADVMKYDEATKRIQFMSLFEGQALEVIHRLDEQSRKYEDMKNALLSAYGMSVDELKKQFFTASISDDETAIQFGARLKGYFEQWRRKDGADDTVEGIKDLIFRAQFVKSCPKELVTRLKMDKVKSLEAMKDMANSYFEACGRKKKPVKINNSQALSSVSGNVASAPAEHSRSWHSPKGNNTYGMRPRVGYSGPHFKQSHNQSWRHPQRGNFERKQTPNVPTPPVNSNVAQGL